MTDDVAFELPGHLTPSVAEKEGAEAHFFHLKIVNKINDMKCG